MGTKRPGALEARIKRAVRDIPDFPKPGIVFKDITPLLAEPALFGAIVDGLQRAVVRSRADGLVAIESRGFLFGAPLARALALPLQLVRKPGKLPYDTAGYDYALEYGTDRLEVHTDAIRAGGRYAIIDDLLATGGTAEATAHLIEQQGGAVACFAFVIELGFLRGRDRLAGWPLQALARY